MKGSFDSAEIHQSFFSFFLFKSFFLSQSSKIEGRSMTVAFISGDRKKLDDCEENNLADADIQYLKVACK